MSELELATAFRTWAETAVHQVVQQLQVDAAPTRLRVLRRAMSGSWNAWLDWAREQRRDSRRVCRFRFRVANRQVVAAWQAWVDQFVAGSVTAVVRTVDRVILQAWNLWNLCQVTTQHQKPRSKQTACGSSSARGI